MATSSQTPNINDALQAEKDRTFRAQTAAQLTELIAAVGALTKEVAALKEVRPAPAPTFQAEAPVARPDTKKSKE